MAPSSTEGLTLLTPFTWLVDTNASGDEAQKKARRAIRWLNRRGIVPLCPNSGRQSLQSRTELVAKLEGGPEDAMKGASSADVAIEVIIGRTMIGMGGQLKSLSCPHCGFPCAANDVQWEGAVEQWYVDGGEGLLRCKVCHVRSSVTLWRFNDGQWALGNLAIGVRRNALDLAQIEELRSLLGRDSVRVC